jgi:hypothetical protein
MAEDIGHATECIKKYFRDPDEIRYCTAEGVKGVCTRDCGVYRSREIEDLSQEGK